MPHVSIRIGPDENDDRDARVVIDGVDITKAVLAEGFAVDFTRVLGMEPYPKAVVSMRLMVDRLDMDLPEGVLNLLDTTTEA